MIELGGWVRLDLGAALTGIDLEDVVLGVLIVMVAALAGVVLTALMDVASDAAASRRLRPRGDTRTPEPAAEVTVLRARYDWTGETPRRSERWTPERSGD